MHVALFETVDIIFNLKAFIPIHSFCNILIGARLKGRVHSTTTSPKKIQLVQKIGTNIKLTQDFENVLKDIFEKVIHCLK
jgi:hypothetical protein